MTEKQKARRLGKGAGLAKHPDANDSNKNDPLQGGFSLGKQSRIKRPPKRAWERRSR
jgi:hypothetical protein